MIAVWSGDIVQQRTVKEREREREYSCVAAAAIDAERLKICSRTLMS